jgi:hypothetical protein
MSIGTRIGRNGINAIDGASGCQISAHSNNAGFGPYKLESSGSTTVGGAFTLDGPGFYWVSGSTTTTGTLPAPATHPGAFIMLREVSGSSFMLTGSARSAAAGVFCRNGTGIGSVSGSVGTIAGGGLTVGDKLTVPGVGSVCLWADGAFWVPQASSGSLQIAA